MHALFLAALALQAPAAGTPQAIAPRACTAAPNQVSTERLQFTSTAFRFSGRIGPAEGRSDDYVPAAVITLTGGTPLHELSIFLAERNGSRYDVTQRRVVGGEMRERQVLGAVRSQESVDFEIEVAGDQATFRVGDLRSTVPLNGLQPTSVDMSCASGVFRFENLAFVFNNQTVQQAAAATPAAASADGRPGRQRVVCRTFPVLGSRLSRNRLCLTQSQWAERENQLGQMRRDLQNRNPGVTTYE